MNCSSNSSPVQRTRLPVWPRTVVAVLAGLAGASIPAVIFWFAIRGADGSYPGNAEGLLLVASPFLAGLAFVLVAPAPWFKQGAVFAAAVALPLDALAWLTVFRDDPSDVGPVPLAVLGVWMLCALSGIGGAGMASRTRSWMAGEPTPFHVLRGRLRQLTCRHDWELPDEQPLVGDLDRRSSREPAHTGQGGGYHEVYWYQCRLCGRVRKDDGRWRPVR